MYVLVQSLYYRIHGPSLNYSLAIQHMRRVNLYLGTAVRVVKPQMIIYRQTLILCVYDTYMQNLWYMEQQEEMIYPIRGSFMCSLNYRGEYKPFWFCKRP